MVMAVSEENIYKSENGDSWRLFRDTASGRALVRHKANPSSGGLVTDMDGEEFLSRGGSGPEYAALRALLERPTNACHQNGPIQDDPIARTSGAEEDETLIGYFPPGNYRLETGPDGVKLIRRGEVEPAATVGAGPATPASLGVLNRNRRLWNRRHEDW